MTSWPPPGLGLGFSTTASSTDPSSPLSVSPTETALLLIDYQNLVVTRLGEAGPSVVKIASQMRDWALHRGMSVFHCLVDTGPGAQPPEWSRIAAKWKMQYQEKLASAAWLGWEVDAIAPRGGDTLSGPGSLDDPVEQQQQQQQQSPGFAPAHAQETTVLRQPGLVSALESQGLMETLRARGIKSLILCGIATSGCVLSTARAATDRGFIVTVVEDACFDPVPGLHAMLVRHVLSTTAHVATSGEVKDAWMIF